MFEFVFVEESCKCLQISALEKQELRYNIESAVFRRFPTVSSVTKQFVLIDFHKLEMTKFNLWDKKVYFYLKLAPDRCQYP